MKKLLFASLMLFFTALSYAQIEGKWKTIDDETGKPKSIVEIFKKSDGKYYGRIVQLLAKPEHETCVKCSDDRKNKPLKPEHETCVKCSDDRKNKPLVGLEIIRGLKKDDEEFTGGNITDPKNGKTYKCTITKDGAEKLNVRGYIGFSLIGRSQTWYKVK